MARQSAQLGVASPVVAGAIGEVELRQGVRMAAAPGHGPDDEDVKDAKAVAAQAAARQELAELPARQVDLPRVLQVSRTAPGPQVKSLQRARGQQVLPQEPLAQGPQLAVVQQVRASPRRVLEQGSTREQQSVP
jgi:hypothetical protein